MISQLFLAVVIFHALIMGGSKQHWEWMQKSLCCVALVMIVIGVVDVDMSGGGGGRGGVDGDGDSGGGGGKVRLLR